jgi:hypothetical protein
MAKVPIERPMPPRGPLFRATIGWNGRRNGLGWFTSEFWSPSEVEPGKQRRPQLLLRRDTWSPKGGWYASRWSRTKSDWVPVRGSNATNMHDCAVRAYVKIDPTDALRNVGRYRTRNGKTELIKVVED